MSDVTSNVMGAAAHQTQVLDPALESFEAAYKALLNERPGIFASESGSELAWIKKARDNSAYFWRSQGLPTKRLERWKYTSVAQIAESRITVQAGVDYHQLPSRDAFERVHGEFAAELVFLNGHYIPQWSNVSEQSGVSVLVLSQLFQECVENGWSAERIACFSAFKEHLESSDADQETPFAAMNTSFMQDAVLINVQSKVVIDKPILLTQLRTSNATSKDLPMSTPRIFAHLQRASQASLIEHYAGDENSTAYFTNAVSDVRLEEGARLSYVKIQSEALQGLHIGTTRVHQKADSWVENFQFSFGAKLSRQDLHISLEGHQAEAVLDGLYLARGQQHIDNFTAVEHLVPHTSSSQIYKGILGDESRAVFNGRVHIHRDAQKSNAGQLNQNLLLSRKAEVNTKPELEIDADDVKASHGASIGQLDPDHVFYLQTRAISRESATRMLARGFALDVVFRIQNAAVRKVVESVVDSHFNQLDVTNVTVGK